MERAIQVGIEELRKRGELSIEVLKNEKESEINAQK
jgi:hypothetical protein